MGQIIQLPQHLETMPYTPWFRPPSFHYPKICATREEEGKKGELAGPCLCRLSYLLPISKLQHNTEEGMRAGQRAFQPAQLLSSCHSIMLEAPV